MDNNDYNSYTYSDEEEEIRIGSLNDAPRPKGRGIGAFGSSSGLDSGSSAEI